MEICYKHQFCAAHRLVGHEGKCARIHGHNYLVKTVVRSQSLNKLGMVMDFGDLKRTVGHWLDENWDHRFLLYEADHLLKDYLPAATLVAEYGLVVVPFNPTAENMAKFLLPKFNNVLATAGFRPDVVSVTVFETDKGGAKECL